MHGRLEAWKKLRQACSFYPGSCVGAREYHPLPGLSFAKQAKSREELGVKVEVLGEAQMQRLGMGALLGVGQGSVREVQDGGYAVEWKW